MADKAILFDTTKCIACRACQIACKQWNELESEHTSNEGTYENPTDLSPQTWLTIKFNEIQRQGKIDWLFSRRSCMHCTDAACVKVCPTGALYHHELGMVAYNKDICSGCGYCIEFCPFDVPRSTRNLLTGAAKIDKCTMCTSPGLDRNTTGYEPACVATCPTNALTYGDRNTLLAEAKERVTQLQSKGFTNSYLYGERELNGLHVLYILDDSPEKFGLPTNPKMPDVAIAWKDIIQPVGWAIGGLAVLGLGLNYLVARKAKVDKETAKRKEE
jgi:formate dehydrogenase beta subunit